MFGFSHSFLIITTLVSLGLSLHLTISLRPKYVERAQSLNRVALPRNFWFAFLAISFIWILAFWFSPQNFWVSTAIFAPSVCLAAVDAQTHFLPNKLLILAWVAAGVELLLVWSETKGSLPVLAIVVGLLGSILFWFSAMAGVGVGMGDVKLVPPILIIAVLSQNLLLYIAALCVLPGLYAIFVFLRSASLKQRIAYGPWIVIALPFSMLLGTHFGTN